MYRNAHGEVPKLIVANYLAWSEGIEFLLKGAGLWQIVSSSELPPQEPIVAIHEPTPEPSASRASTTRSSATKATTSTISSRRRYHSNFKMPMEPEGANIRHGATLQHPTFIAP